MYYTHSTVKCTLMYTDRTTDLSAAKHIELNIFSILCLTYSTRKILILGQMSRRKYRIFSQKIIEAQRKLPKRKGGNLSNRKFYKHYQKFFRKT